jgi:hypothetical protein
MAVVKAGHRYYYNNAYGALYPWSPDLEKVKGLTLFTAPRDGEFNTSMLLVGEAAPEAPVAKAKPARAKTVKYVAAEAPPAPTQGNTVEVPTASGSATIPAVNLTASEQSDA